MASVLDFMLLATGIAYSTWVALLAAFVIFLIGTEVRVRSEESLLSEAFGQKFDDYAHLSQLSFLGCNKTRDNFFRMRV
jgi:protein-S-isoprenylcysteine O-methyltransferase Ste14